MALPFFYKADIEAAAAVVLDEDTSKHVVQVLRMQNGEQLQLTDGKGNIFTCAITDNNRKRCAVSILSAQHLPLTEQKVSVAVSLLKNVHRFEWFLEKATEIGVSEIIPLICTRTEKQHFKAARLQSILISAMLQSQQCRLPQMGEPVPFRKLLAGLQTFGEVQKFIAHCEDENSKTALSSKLLQPSTARLILIGPEGDFTPEEIQLALQNGFAPVSLGNTRLRTETAGVVAAVTLMQ